MEGHASEAGSEAEEPNYFCYKTYIKAAGYTLFTMYSAVGIKRMRERLDEYFLMDRCSSCTHYGGSNIELMFWGAFDALLYALAPLCALVALIYADLEWFFPAYAIRVMFPSFMLIGPVLFTIVSYITYWFIDLVIDVQQVSEDLLDMVVWKRCIWASTLFLANIYALLLTLVVLQLIYYQHNIVIEEQFFREHRHEADAGIQYHNFRHRHMNRHMNAVAVAHNHQNHAHVHNVENV